MTSGLQEGDLVVIAGRPSMGKTALALNIGEHIALALKMPVAIFSMEMGATQLAMRLMGSVGRLDQHKIRTGRLSNDDWERLSGALGRLNDAPIHIDETPALNALELRARARRLSRQYGGKLGADRRRLSAADAGGRRRREPRDRDIRDIALAQGAGQGAQGAGDGAVAAQPQPRAAAEQAAGDVGPARIGSHRAGRRRDPVHLPRRSLQPGHAGQGHRRDHHRQAAQRPDRHRCDSPSWANTRVSRISLNTAVIDEGRSLAVQSPVSRNAPCPCGSGRRFKECHGAAPATAAPPVLSLLTSALEAQKAGRLSEALERYQSVVASQPDNFDARHMLGVVHYQRGDLELARQHVAAAVRLRPLEAAAHKNLLLIDMALERRGVEQDICREVLRRLVPRCVARESAEGNLRWPDGDFDIVVLKADIGASWADDRTSGALVWIARSHGLGGIRSAAAGASNLRRAHDRTGVRRGSADRSCGFLRGRSIAGQLVCIDDRKGNRALLQRRGALRAARSHTRTRRARGVPRCGCSLLPRRKLAASACLASLSTKH